MSCQSYELVFGARDLANLYVLLLFAARRIEEEAQRQAAKEEEGEPSVAPFCLWCMRLGQSLLATLCSSPQRRGSQTPG